MRDLPQGVDRVAHTVGDLGYRRLVSRKHRVEVQARGSTEDVRRQALPVFECVVQQRHSVHGKRVFSPLEVVGLDLYAPFNEIHHVQRSPRHVLLLPRRKRRNLRDGEEREVVTAHDVEHRHPVTSSNVELALGVRNARRLEQLLIHIQEPRCLDLRHAGQHFEPHRCLHDEVRERVERVQYARIAPDGPARGVQDFRYPQACNIEELVPVAHAARKEEARHTLQPRECLARLDVVRIVVLAEPAEQPVAHALRVLFRLRVVALGERKRRVGRRVRVIPPVFVDTRDEADGVAHNVVSLSEPEYILVDPAVCEEVLHRADILKVML